MGPPRGSAASLEDVEVAAKVDAFAFAALESWGAEARPSQQGMEQLTAMYCSAEGTPDKEALKSCRRLQLVALLTKVLGLLAATPRGPAPGPTFAVQDWLEEAAAQPGAGPEWDWVGGLRLIADVTCDALRCAEPQPEAAAPPAVSSGELSAQLLVVARHINAKLLPEPRLLPALRRQQEETLRDEATLRREEEPRGIAPAEPAGSYAPLRRTAAAASNGPYDRSTSATAAVGGGVSGGGGGAAAAASHGPCDRSASSSSSGGAAPQAAPAATASASSSATARVPMPRLLGADPFKLPAGGPPVKRERQQEQPEWDFVGEPSPGQPSLPSQLGQLVRTAPMPTGPAAAAADEAQCGGRDAERVLFEPQLLAFEEGEPPREGRGLPRRRLHPQEQRIRSEALPTQRDGLMDFDFDDADGVHRAKVRLAWSDDEEHNLIMGHRKYGSQWEKIRESCNLKHRLGTQLRDKWRNLSNKGVV